MLNKDHIIRFVAVGSKEGVDRGNALPVRHRFAVTFLLSGYVVLLLED